MFKDHLEQLAKAGHLKAFVVGQGYCMVGKTLGNRGNALPLPLGVIEVIPVASVNTRANYQKRGSNYYPARGVRIW